MLSALALLGAAIAAPLSVETPVTAIVADGGTLLAVGPEGSVVADVATRERRPVDLSARQALLVKLGGEAGRGLVTCGDGGLQLWSWPQRELLQTADESCRAMARLGPGVVRLGEGEVTQHMPFMGTSLVKELTTPVELPEGELLVAGGGGVVAIAVVGEEGIYEHSLRGTSTLATGGPVHGLARLDDAWAWSVPDEDLVLTRTSERLTAREPGRILPADLDGDGQTDLVVAHPDRLGVIIGEAERLLPYRGPVDAIGVEDRPCGAVWVAGGGRLTALPSPCASGLTAPAAASSPAPAAAPTAPAPSAAPAPAPASATPSTVILDGVQVPVVKAVVGQTLQLRLQDAGNRPMTFAARGGPEGMVVYPDGALEYTPTAGQEGRYSIAIRMTYGLTRRSATMQLVVEGQGASVAPTSSPGTPASPAAVRTGQDGVTDYRLTRRRASANDCYFGFGAASAVTDVGLTFDFPGQRLVGSVSPRLSLTCEGDERPVSMWVRGSTAPFLFYVTPVGDPLVSVATGSLGVSYGSDVASIGAYVTAGLLAAGAGLRGTWRPIETKARKRAGLVLDLAVYTPARFAAGANLLWELPL